LTSLPFKGLINFCTDTFTSTQVSSHRNFNKSRYQASKQNAVTVVSLQWICTQLNEPGYTYNMQFKQAYCPWIMTT